MKLERKSDTVSIVGFSQLTRDLVPWENEDMEVWSLNERYKHGYLKRWDRWFQMHPYANCMRENNQNDPDHPAWLKQKHKFPIYMMERFPDIPASVRFPIEDVTKFLGRRYFMSGFSFMMALAMYMEFKTICIYGFDMSNETEYARQRPNAEWLIGFAEGRGIKIEIPPICRLMTGMTYCYDTIMTGFRQQLEFRQKGLAANMSESLGKFHEAKGRAELLKNLQKDYRFLVGDKIAPLAELEAPAMKDAKTQGAVVNTVNGAVQELAYIVDNYDFFGEESRNVEETK